jgi:hypothetical protein
MMIRSATTMSVCHEIEISAGRDRPTTKVVTFAESRQHYPSLNFSPSQLQQL